MYTFTYVYCMYMCVYIHMIYIYVPPTHSPQSVRNHLTDMDDIWDGGYLLIVGAHNKAGW